MRKRLLTAGAALAVLWIGGGPPLAQAGKTRSSGVEARPKQVLKERLMKAVEELKHPSAETRRKAVEYLGQAGDMSVVKPLASALADPQAEVREQAGNSMWRIWLRSGDPETDKILHLGIELMGAGQFQQAINAFTRVIERAPDFAEGYNKRATALYLAKRYKESLVDCDVTIRLNPYHFGALFGIGLNYAGLNDLPKALQAFQDTLKVVPYSEPAKLYIGAIKKRLKPEETEL